MSNDSNWDSGWNTSGSGNPWDFEPKDPLGGGSSHETEERHAFGESDVPPWPSRNYDATPPREGRLSRCTYRNGCTAFGDGVRGSDSNHQLKNYRHRLNHEGSTI